jgi:hypothetical protein
MRERYESSARLEDAGIFKFMSEYRHGICGMPDGVNQLLVMKPGQKIGSGILLS